MTRQRKITLAVGLLITAAAFFYLNSITSFYADDYSYMFTYAANAPKTRITSLHELWLSQLNHYKVMNGRAIVHTLVQLFLMGETRTIFNVANTLVFLALGFAVYYAARGTFKDFRPLRLFAVYALIWLTLPGFGQSCLWLTGSINYMWTTFAALCFLLPYRAESAPDGRVVLRSAGMFILGVLAGWSGENACIAAAVGLVLLLIRRALLKERIRVWMWVGAVGFVLGAALLFFAPAQALKADNMGGMGSISTWLHRIPSVSFGVLRYLWLPLVIGVVLLIVSVVQSRGKGFMYWLRRYSDTLAWLCAAIVSAYCMCAAPYFPVRAWCCAGVLAAATVLSAFDKVEKPKLGVLWLPAACIVTAAACAVSFVLGARDIIATRADVTAREESILAQKSEGIERVTAQSVSGHSRYNCFDPGGDLSEDPESWQNGALARYYGVESVYLEPKP